VQPFIGNLANVFIEEGLFDYALETYNKGRKTNPDYPFFYERAEIFKAKNDITAMINEYLDALEFRETEIQTVQMNLQNSLGYDDQEGGIKNPLLKAELQKRIQTNPDKIVLTEFLIFIEKQQLDFDGAFVQSKALDKRLNEDGRRVYELAQICVSNERWETAKRCYSYIIQKGSENVYYEAATVEELNLEYLILTQMAQPDNEAMLLLEQKLIKANEKYKLRFLNAQILKNLVNLKAYYLNKSEEAIVLLEDFIEQPGVGGMNNKSNTLANKNF
jgi:tetratricopeptide (TPR) repeat protein